MKEDDQERMEVVKTSTLPAVLKEYLPEYEPNYRTQKLHRHQSDSSKPNSASPSSRIMPESQEHPQQQHRNDQDQQLQQQQQLEHHGHQSHSSQSQQKVEDNGEYHKTREDGPLESRRSMRTLPSRNRQRSMRAAEMERYCKLFETWNQAKQGVLEERHQSLKEKIVLQQQLIKAQDILACQRRREAQLQLDQLKHAQREKKQARDTALQQVCRQSLEDDRRSSNRRRSRSQQSSRSQDESSNAASETVDPFRHRGSGRMPRVIRSPRLPSSPMRELENEDDEDLDANNAADAIDLDSLPWHHAQLYRLYGSQAEYFIHPKIEAQEKPPFYPRLKKHAAPYIGAEKLWNTLRGESKVRLLHEDERFPQELKVPEMDRLMDKRSLYKVRTMRHRTELMFRSSRNNQDRTKILVFNNPLPDVNEGDTSVGRYLPSWLDIDSESDVPEYAKWIVPSLEEPRESMEEESQEDLHDETLENIWDTMITRGKSKVTPQPRYHFLTEKAARTPGRFSEKFKEEREKKNIPQPHHMTGMMKAQSTIGFSESPSTSPETLYSKSKSRCQSAREEVWRHRLTNWEPLSMSALMEYKDHRDTTGDGEFQQGRNTMWPVATSST